MRCNDPLQPVAKAAVLHRLPPMVRVQQQSFSRCPRCARLYWPGSHWQRMRGRLDTLLAATRPPDDSQHLNGSGSGACCPRRVCDTFRGHNKEPRMDSVDVFSVRDLRQRSGDLIREAEHGHLSLITKHGRPTILAVPFDHRLLELGVHRTLALRLFEQRHLTLVQAARLAAMTAEEFVALLGDAGVPAVDYPPDELAEEISTAL